ncbi:hypothetical protein H6G89_18550 [Oscillatoria sp. FACHB-1407]|uniref:hypothetical protein n=1 Tax=Oscillatoria sp. FACHB-1407 TaxID=2692847 RepID=UPI0016837DA9|nr:hypothetical protein [Oscillatoria sp. FACHB-1407]MBD2463041.1 hypothetical protein [Oscillatoria sp. FACHB-1407]
MLKLYRSSLIALVFIAPLITVPVLAQSTPPSDQELENRRRPRDEGIIRQRTSPLDNLEQTFEQNRRPRGEGIRRGAICAISPATDRLQTEAVIWSDRPLFLWRTDPTVIRVTSIQVYNLETNEIAWEKDLAPADQRALFEGNPLQPGQIYVWELAFERQNPTTQTWEPETLSYTFEVLAGDRREQITAGLQQLSGDHTQNTSQDVAISQANYLMQQGLLSDGLQILYRVSTPTPQLSERLQTLTNSVCES